MKKRTKILLAILSAAAISAGVAGFAGCGGGAKETHNEAYYTEYQEYVDAKKKAKEDYLSYEEWLTLKLFEEADGKAGSNGKDGAAWLTGTTAPAATDGKDGDFYINTTNFTIYSKSNGVWTELGSIMGSDGVGEDGVGIESVEYKDGKIVIHLTNGETKEVELPAQVTHVHAYDDENVVTLIEPTAESDGLGYKVCTDPDCNHLELVILSMRYLVTVRDYNGNVLEGETVIINGAKGVTDENGVANVFGYGYKNDYIISVEGKDTDKTYRTDENHKVDIVVIDALDTARDHNNLSYSAITGEGVYPINLSTTNGSTFIADKEVLLIGGETTKAYEITPLNDTIGNDGNYASLKFNKQEVWGSRSYTVVVYPGEQVKLAFNANTMVLDQNDFKYGDNLRYCVSVEEVELAELGTEEHRINVEIGKTYDLIPGTTTYFRYFKTEGETNSVDFTLSDGVTAAVHQKSIVSSAFVDSADPTPVAESGNVSLGLSTASYSAGAYIFSVTAADGATNPQFTFNTPEGSQYNPKTLTHGTQAEADDTTWYEYTVDSAISAKAIDVIYTEGELEIYNAQMQRMNRYRNPEFNLHLAEGTYYFRLEYGGTLLVKDYDAATEAFYSMDGAKAIDVSLTGESFTVDISAQISGTWAYYKFTATKSAYLYYEGGDSVNFYVNGSAGHSCEEDDEVIISIYKGGSASSVTINFMSDSVDPGPGPGEGPGEGDDGDDDQVEAAKFMIEFTDNNGEPADLTGATVKIMKGTEEIASGTVEAKKIIASEYDTSSDNFMDWDFIFVEKDIYVCSLEFKPGNYDIVIEYEGGTVKYDLTGFTTEYMKPEYCDPFYEFENGKITRPYDYEQDDFPETGEYTEYYATTINLKSYFQAKFKVVSDDPQDTHEFKNLTVDICTYDMETGSLIPTGLTLTIGADGWSEEVEWLLPEDTWYLVPVLTGADAESYGLKEFYECTQLSPGGFGGSELSYITLNELEITVFKKNEYQVKVLGVSGAALANVTVQMIKSGEVVAEAETDDFGMVTLKAFTDQYTIRVVKNTLPDGTNAPDIVTNYSEAPTEPFVIRLAEGDKIASGYEDAHNLHMLGSNDGVDSYTIITGLNVVTNEETVGYYKFVAPGAGTYKITLNDASAKGYFSYVDYAAGRSDEIVLIANGRQQLLAKDIVLGANRGINKVYEVTLTLAYGESVVIGYHTGTNGGATAKITVEELTEVVEPTILTGGDNEVTLVDGTLTASFEMDDPYWNGLTITWDDPDIIVEINGVMVENGEVFEFDMDDEEPIKTIVITSLSGANKTVTINVEETPLDMGGPGGWW